jgi:hypothetical protein
MTDSSGLDEYEIQLMQDRTNTDDSIRCESCGSIRLGKVFGNTNDRCEIVIEHLDIYHDGYPFDISGVCGGDDVDLTFCLDCGKIQHFVSPSDDDLISMNNHGEDT